MQLILQNCFKDELIARQKYFYETFHLWLIIKSQSDNYIKLVSMPTNCLDILFIIGHNTFVKAYLNCHKINEKRIVPSHVMARFDFLLLNFRAKFSTFLTRMNKIMQTYFTVNFMVSILI